MLFIWRGFGIVVPILLFISGWITSYWFENTRLADLKYMGWTLLWAGIVLIFGALAALGGNVDENGESVPKENKVYNDFFWIPIWVWCIGFIGLGMYFIFQDESPDEDSYYSSTTTAGTKNRTTYDSQAIVESTEPLQKRALNLYNCAADSIQIEIANKDNDVAYDFYVQSFEYEFATIEPNDYTVKVGGRPWEVELNEVTKRNEVYNDAWLILCSGIDFILVDVTEICKPNLTENDVLTIDWMDNVVDRYDGNYLIEPKIYPKNDGKIKVVPPHKYIPQQLDNKQSVYVLLGVDSDVKASEDFLDKKLVKLSIR